MRAFLFSLTLLACGLTLAACGPFDADETSENATSDAQVLAAKQPDQPQAAGLLGRPNAWADCELFASLVTPTAFKPGAGRFDELYSGTNGFKDGVQLISDSKPGDADYNGGRWHLNLLKSGVDPNKYSDACKVEDLDLSDFESTPNYFECPLLPRRGRGPR